MFIFTNHNIFYALLYKSNSIRIDTKAFVILLLLVLEIKFMTSHCFNSIGSRKIMQLQISPDFFYDRMINPFMSVYNNIYFYFFC